MLRQDALEAAAVGHARGLVGGGAVKERELEVGGSEPDLEAKLEDEPGDGARSPALDGSDESILERSVQRGLEPGQVRCCLEGVNEVQPPLTPPIGADGECRHVSVPPRSR